MRIKEVTFSLSASIANPFSTYENRKPMYSVTVEVEEEDSLNSIRKLLHREVLSYLKEIETQYLAEWKVRDDIKNGKPPEEQAGLPSPPKGRVIKASEPDF